MKSRGYTIPVMSFFSEKYDQCSKHTRRGHSTVTFLIAMVVMLMFGFAGLEIGLIYRSANLASSVADATALAAANRITAGFDTSLLVARDIAQKHTGPNGPLDLLPFDEPNSGGDLEFGYWNPLTKTFEPNLENINAVRSTVHFNSNHPNGSIPLIFGNYFGFSYADLSRQAVAIMNSGTESWALFIGTDSTSTPSYGRDDAEILVPNNGVSILSSVPNGFELTGNSYLSCTTFSSVGQIHVSTENRIDGTIQTLQNPVTRDGLDFYNPPFSIDSDSPELTAEASSGTTLLEPGWYPEGFTANLGTYILEDGTYIFGGSGISLENDAQILGDNAIVILTDSSGLTLNQSSQLNLGPVYREHSGIMTSMLITGNTQVLISDEATLECVNAILAENADIRMQGGQLTAGYLATSTLDARVNANILITGNAEDNTQPEYPGSTLVD